CGGDNRIMDPARPARRASRHRFLISGGSSIQLGHIPLGLTVLAFFTTVIFILLLLCRAGRGMRQRNECRFETALVTCRHVHVAKLRMGGRDAPAGADRNECTVAARLPWSEPVEFLARAVPPRVMAVADVPGRERQLTGEAGARIERAVRPDRVRMLLVYVARTVVHAVVRRKPQAPGFLAQERHLVVEDVARIAGRACAGADR